MIRNTTLPVAASTPLELIYNPSAVKVDKLLETTQTVFEMLNKRGFINSHTDLYEKSLEAAYKWRDLSKAIPPKTAMQVSQKCAQILQIADKFKKPTDTEKYELILQDGSIAITPKQMDFLRFHSVTLNSMLEKNMLESNTRTICLKHEAIHSESMRWMINLLYDPEGPLPEDASLLDLLEAAEFLNIPHLQRRLLEILKMQLMDLNCPTEAALISFDFLLSKFEHEKELLDCCFDLLQFKVYSGEVFDTSEIVLRSPFLINMSQGLHHLFKQEFDAAKEAFQNGSQEEWKCYFLLMARAQGGHLNGRGVHCGDYKMSMLYLQNGEIEQERAKRLISDVKFIRPDHPWITGLEGNLFNNTDILEAQVRKTPDVIFWRQAKVNIFMEKGYYHDVTRECYFMSEKDPSYAQAYFDGAKADVLTIEQYSYSSLIENYLGLTEKNHAAALEIKARGDIGSELALALKNIEASLALDPVNKKALSTKAIILIHHGFLKEAECLLPDLEGLEKIQATALLWIYQKKRVEALELLDKALVDYPKDDMCLSLKTLALAYLKRFKNANEFINPNLRQSRYRNLAKLVLSYKQQEYGSAFEIGHSHSHISSVQFLKMRAKTMHKSKTPAFVNLVKAIKTLNPNYPLPAYLQPNT